MKTNSQLRALFAAHKLEHGCDVPFVIEPEDWVYFDDARHHEMLPSRTWHEGAAYLYGEPVHCAKANRHITPDSLAVTVHFRYRGVLLGQIVPYEGSARGEPDSNIAAAFGTLSLIEAPAP